MQSATRGGMARHPFSASGGVDPGGTFIPASAESYKDKMRDLLAWYRRQMEMLIDAGRKAGWIVKIKTTRKPEAQLLGSAISMKVMEDVPYHWSG